MSTKVAAWSRSGHHGDFPLAPCCQSFLSLSTSSIRSGKKRLKQIGLTVVSSKRMATKHEEGIKSTESHSVLIEHAIQRDPSLLSYHSSCNLVNTSLDSRRLTRQAESKRKEERERETS